MSRTTGYLVLSHTDPEQVERLVRAIVQRSSMAHVLVAHDSRTTPVPLISHSRVRVWEHGMATDWGSWSLVEVTLEGMRKLQEWASPEMVALASGQDYVCADLLAWEMAFLRTGGWVGSASPLSYSPRWGKRLGEGNDAWTRYHYLWFDVPKVLDRIPTKWARSQAARLRNGLFLRLEPLVAFRVIQRAGRHLVGFRAGDFPLAEGRPVYKGQQMLAMDSTLLERVLSVCQTDSALVRRYRRSVIPDESMIQTVLSWERAPRTDLVLTYIGWDSASDGGRSLDVSDLPTILSSGAALCRKVTSETGSELCDSLDAIFADNTETQ